MGKRLDHLALACDQPMVPYLAFFAAGDFTIAVESTGLPWLVAVSQGPRGRRGGQHRPMKKTPKVVAGLE